MPICIDQKSPGGSGACDAHGMEIEDSPSEDEALRQRAWRRERAKWIGVLVLFTIVFLAIGALFLSQDPDFIGGP